MRNFFVPHFARRPLAALLVFAAILMLNFVLIQATDTGRLRQESLHQRNMTAEDMEERIASFRRQFDLDRPLPERFCRWVGRTLRLDLGVSMLEPRNVRNLIGEALGRSLWLQLPSLFLFYLIGLPLGVYLASRPRHWLSRLLDSSLIVLYAMPTFWVATLLLIYGATGQGLDLFPLEGLSSQSAESQEGWAFLMDRLQHLALPVTALALPGITVIARQTRTAMADTLTSDFVLAARAAGMTEQRVLWRHAFPHALLPAATLLGLLLPQLVGGSVVVESIFNIHGMGLLLLQSAQERDFPVLQALILMTSVMTLLGFLLSDWLAMKWSVRGSMT